MVYEFHLCFHGGNICAIMFCICSIPYWNSNLKWLIYFLHRLGSRVFLQIQAIARGSKNDDGARAS